MGSEPSGLGSAYGHEHGSGGVPAAISGGSDADDWPPVSFAENDHILVWWLPEYDDMLRQLVDEYQWAWRSQVNVRLNELVPETVLRAWRDADPMCREWLWYHVLDVFAVARAKKLGISPRPPRRVVCTCCSDEFLESHLPYSLIARVGADRIGQCEKCLSQALWAKGSPTSTPEGVTGVLQALSGALGRAPKSSDLSGRLDFKVLAAPARAAVVAALRVKPTVSRVKELFESWDAAVAHAAAAPATALPPFEPVGPSLPRADAAFTSNDPTRYRLAAGSLPEVTLRPGRDRWTCQEEVQSLIGTGYLALAEAALMQLQESDQPFHAYLLAQVYGQTARFDEATALLAGTYGENYSSNDPLWPRDLRTITSGPVFYEPLATLPRGNVRFVLVGGPMEYVDRRGEHSCITGESPEGEEAEFAESVTRMNAMVDGTAWIRAAAEVGQAIMTSLRRAGAEPRPYGHVISYITSTVREVVKTVTGSLPKKVAENAWRLGPVAKSKWSYEREAGRYIYNANADFSFMTVEAAPAVCIWGWPDRSDLCLQAFLDTIAAGASDPVTVILPDVPAFRSFSRRYVRRDRMEDTGRALMEEGLYRASMVNKRGYVISAEFAPTLIVHPDGAEDDGAALTGALAYLNAHHTLRLAVWDVLSDALLRQVTAAMPSDPRPFTVAASKRTDMVNWYAHLSEYNDADALLSPYRPGLLDEVALT